MEGTSGAADLAALRGASGEATLGPDGRAAQAAMAANRAERCWSIRASGSLQRAVSVRRLLTSYPVERRAGEREAAGGLRKRDAWGPTSPRFLARAKARAAASLSVTSVSSRWRGGVVTRGVRADRVGAKLS
jgi:hypothetical protein